MLLIIIRNYIPYLVLVAVYFFLVNIEATKDFKKYQNTNININKKSVSESEKTYLNNPKGRIKIPVIPYTNKK